MHMTILDFTSKRITGSKYLIDMKPKNPICNRDPLIYIFIYFFIFIYFLFREAI
jgi:hypothetical protein